MKKDYYANPPKVDFTGIPVFNSAKQGMEWIARNRWGKVDPTCPDCGRKNKGSLLRSNDVRWYICKDKWCIRDYFNPLTLTSLEGTQLPVHFWLFAAREFNKGKLGMNTQQLANALDVSQSNALKMYRKLGDLYRDNHGGILGEFAPIHEERIKTNPDTGMPMPQNKNETLFFPKRILPPKLCKRWSVGGKSKRTTISVNKLSRRFDDDSAAQFFTDLRWSNGVKCPDCHSSHIGTCSRSGYFRCHNKQCKRDQFNYKTYTPMMNSNLSPTLWASAMYEVMLARQGSSALEFMNRQGLSYKTAFYLFHRLRMMMETTPDGSAVGPLEVDEVFITADKSKKEEAARKGNPFPLKSGNKAIIGVRCRTTGKAFVKMIGDLTGQTALDFINECAGGKKVAVFTDGWKGYKSVLGQYGHHHEYTDHSAWDFAHESAWKIIHEKAEDNASKRGKKSKNVVHNNTCESMWRQLRDSLRGVYRHISMKYLMAYMSETAFRLDEGRVSRDIGSRIAAMYLNGIGKYTTYSKMTAA